MNKVEDNGEILSIKQNAFTRDYVKDIKYILSEARKHSYKTVNSIMIQANWLVGWRIVEQEQNGELGSGMSVAQLKNCRQFYLTFPDLPIGYTLCSQLTWSHIRMIMRLDTEAERNYYIEESKSGNWSVRELERNIKTDMFHRVVKNQLPEKTAKSPKSEIQSHIKDPYVLEFLGLKPDVKNSEKDVENSIISHLEKFLLEMGKGFSFVERQMHVKTETQDFYIDLVFYNYLLKCFVLVDLKQGSLKHQDIGQMDMYVRMFDSLKKGDDDNPTVGIIFCTDKDESIVKYSVLNESEQIFASKYKTVLPTEEELAAELDRNRRFLLENRR